MTIDRPADGRGKDSFPQSFCGLVRSLVPEPIIAAVNGYCLGGGLELLLPCDVVPPCFVVIGAVRWL